MKKLFALAIVTGLALAGVARADDEKGEKKEEKKAGGQKMEMPKPSAEHKKLGYFVGNWTMEGEMKAGPMGPGGKMTGTSNCSWFDGHFAVVCKDSGNSPMGPGKGLGILTYDAEDKKYEYMGIDSMGMAEKAEGAYENDAYVYTSDNKMGGKVWKGRYTISNMKPDTYDFKFEMSEDGTAWNTVMEGKNTKKAAAAAKPAPEKKS